MRVNVYAEELTDRVEIVEKIAGPRRFVGIRFVLDSSPRLHQGDDDDSSAVTLWVRSRRDGYQLGDEDFLARLLERAAKKLRELA